MEDIQAKNEIANSWNLKSKYYDSLPTHGICSPSEKAAWLHLFEQIVRPCPANIIDVGAGTGFCSLLLGELGHTCRGVDLSEGMLSVAKQHAAERGLNKLTFEIGDAENIAAPDNTYDVTISRHLLWTLPHPENAIYEWIRVTKPGGRVIIIDGDWFDSSPLRRFRANLGKKLAARKGTTNKYAGQYSEELVKNLPMMSDGSMTRTIDLIKQTGMKYGAKNTKGIEHAERKIMTLEERLQNNSRRTVFIIYKAEQ